MSNQCDLWTYTLQPNDSGKKYHDILERKFHFSHNLLQKLKQGERVWVNGKFSYLSTRGHSGEILTIQLQTMESLTIPGESLPLQILFEDDFLLAVNKPAGQVIHPTPRYPSGTLGNAVVGYWLAKGETRPFRPVHRIDRNTSGVVIIAKNQFSHQQIAWQLEHNQIGKCYLGFVEGLVRKNEGIIDAPIGLVPGSFIQRQVSPEGLSAVTRYRVLKRFKDASLLEFILETGRTHQIRAHCQDLGHPLLGDDLYGGSLTRFNRQALHSSMYEFHHPLTENKICIRAPWPEDLRKLLSTLEGDS